MRVLLTAAAGTGHVVPLLGVARALRDAGHDVAVATHASRHDLVRDAGVPCLAAGMSEQEWIDERRRRWPESEGQPPATWAVRMFAQIVAPAALPALSQIVARWRPDLVIHEEGEYAGPVAAAGAGLPWVTHGWGSPLRSSVAVAALEADARPLWRSAGLEVPPAAGLYRYGVLDPCPPSLQREVPAAAAVWPVRPVPLASGGRAATDRPLVPADQREALAYVGFGTVAPLADDVAVVTTAVSAVVANGCRAVVTTGDHALREALAVRHRGRVRAERFVRLSDVLPTCRLAVCHGGAGTVLAALAAGVPMVMLPAGTPSQLRMADACARAGVATVSSVAEVEPAVRSLLGDGGSAARAFDLAAEIAAMPDPAELVPVLERVTVS